jgi:hypothetical protein
MTFAKKLPMECTKFAETEVNQHFRQNWQLKFSEPCNTNSNSKHMYIYSSIKAAAPPRHQQQHQQGSSSNTSKAATATLARQQQY